MTLIELAKYEKLMPYAKALAEGKRVQIKNPMTGSWLPVNPNGIVVAYINDELRIAPEPRLRPWKLEEAIGKWVRFKSNRDKMWMIFGTEPGLFKGCTPGGASYSQDPQWYLENCEQLDDSPCGVMEE